MLYLRICNLKHTKSRGIKILPSSHKELGFQPKSFNQRLNSDIKHKDARGNYKWCPPKNPNPNTSESKEQGAHENPMKIARKRHKNYSSYKKKIDTMTKASIHSEVRFLTTWWRKSKFMEKGNEKQYGRMVSRETLELIYMSPSGPGKRPSYP
jgi:hypothetical protein